MFKLKLQLPKQFYLALLISLIIKLIFLFDIGPKLFAEELMMPKDSFSYTESFVNLVNTGEFTHDPTYGPASYGRLPGIAFIWGFFYLLFGKPFAYTAFALFQFLLDVFAAYLVYKIILKYFNERTAIAVNWIYALLPLKIFFIVRTDTDYMSLFVIIATFYQLVFFQPTFKKLLLLVLTLMLGFYVREILMLLVPLSFFYLWRNHTLKFSQYVLMCLLMLVLYLPWPIRTYLKSGEVILVKPFSAGYRDYNKDIISYIYWVYAWHNDDAQEYMVYAYDLHTTIKFPDEIFANETEKKLAVDLTKLARHCGSSFIIWQRQPGIPPPDCNGVYDGLISRGFDLLHDSYRSRHPFDYYVKIPLQNLKKSLFKRSLTHSQQSRYYIFEITMVLRTLLIFLGIIGCIYFRRIDFFKISFLFSIIIYFFISAVIRQVEMRYLFQADTIMLITGGTFLADLFFRRKNSNTQELS